ncbi:SAV_915 family protein [Streptomyces ochraceiscleroticus]|uniref:SAV_915 family protein n=1 Tax=Streptomyces ochraceiscleroticus TaxID=47761 RepID=A0ABW1MPJ1_9ACTN|nr:SAV_915 family protein [Streptomyces ochraceiscleroticus]
MSDVSPAEEPEARGQGRAGALYVPVRPGPAGYAARLFRTPLGERTAVGFTTLQQLVSTLGPGQAWIKLSEPALRALTVPLGITRLLLNPSLAASTAAPSARAAAPRLPLTIRRGARKRSEVTTTLPARSDMATALHAIAIRQHLVKTGTVGAKTA